jgi:hypothetical protein
MKLLPIAGIFALRKRERFCSDGAGENGSRVACRTSRRIRIRMSVRPNSSKRWPQASGRPAQPPT